MTRRIQGDRQQFRRIVEGNVRRELKRFANGQVFRLRAKNGQIAIRLPKIDTPHFTYGDPSSGTGVGPGKPGDVIGRDESPGQGAGDAEGEGVQVLVDLDSVLDLLEEELELPKLKPKERPLFEDRHIRYTDIRKTGQESLRHTRRTMLQALKRLAASGQADELHQVPGFAQPVRLITPVNEDRRYRSYKEVFTPSHNAAIFFARDGSGSMDDEICEIVSDMCWWVDAFIRRQYARVERCYFWHDVAAHEVDEQHFYGLRGTGGTKCSSVLKLMAEQTVSRFPPDRWNLYVFYFTDGDNGYGDNDVFTALLREQFPPEVCNLFGLTQVLAWNPDDTVKDAVEKARLPNVRLAGVGDEYGVVRPLDPMDRDDGVRRAIKSLLGKRR